MLAVVKTLVKLIKQDTFGPYLLNRCVDSILNGANCMFILLVRIRTFLNSKVRSSINAFIPVSVFLLIYLNTNNYLCFMCFPIRWMNELD